MKLSIVLPCYNEIENVKKIENELIPVVKKLEQQYSVELVFVDDGSSDGTLGSLKNLFAGLSENSMAVKFEQHKVNRGLGAALRTGLAAATGDLIVTTDSDGTYKFSSIPDLLDLLTENTDIVTASPYHPQGNVVGVPGYRLVLSRGSSLIYRILVDWKIHTYTALFRVYRAEVIREIQFQSDGFLGGTELMVKAMLSGFKVAEYPAVLYRRVFGVSKAKLLQTIIAHLKFQSRVFLHRLHIVSLTLREGNI